MEWQGILQLVPPNCNNFKAYLKVYKLRLNAEYPATP